MSGSFQGGMFHPGFILFAGKQIRSLYILISASVYKQDKLYSFDNSQYFIVHYIRLYY